MDLEQLLRAVRDGEDGAFDRFVHATTKLLYKYFLGLDVPPEVAEDLTHDVLITVHREVPGKEHPSLRAWLFRVARNRAIDHHRAVARWRETSLSHVRLLLDPRRGLSSEYRGLRQQAKLRELLSQMPLELREVAQLDLDGGDVKAYAASRNITEAAVRARRWRYKEWLRRRFPTALRNS